MIRIALVALALANAAAQPADADDFVRLERPGCYGTCPSFSILVRRDGRATYQGHKYVRVTGTKQLLISRKTAGELILTAQAARLSEQVDPHRNVRDAPRATLTVSVQGKESSFTDVLRHASGTVRELDSELASLVSSFVE